VTLCLFYSRDAAAVVERSLKDRHAPHRAQGGTEWFDVPREELRKDIVAIAHGLAISQMKANRTGVQFFRPELSRYFYGLLVLDIVAGEIRHPRDATPYQQIQNAADWSSAKRVVGDPKGVSAGPADDIWQGKIDFWEHLRRVLLPRRFW
jgi:hypothetical protein